MKYRIIGLCSILLATLIVLAVSFAMPQDNGQRYIQHLDAEPKAPCLSHAGEDVLCSHLPIVRIETGGVAIPGKNIHDESGKIIGYTTAADGSSTIRAELELVDHEDVNNHSSDAATLSSSIEIRLRGHSSRSFDKPNYFIRLVQPDGSNNAQTLLGMDSHHEWALHGPFLDKSLIRNYMWYNLAGQIMDYSPNVRFCELILNGEYRGLYLMMETITAGKDGARLNLEVSKKQNSFSGYLLRLDWGDSVAESRIHPLTDYSLISSSAHEIVYPGTKNLTPELREGIKDDFSAFEKALYSYDYDSKKFGYETYIDVDSFVDYFLLNELSCNYDAGVLSTYIYKDVDGRYRMCVWDFNSACDNYKEQKIEGEGFEMQYALWYYMLFKDQDFVERVIERYHELRESVFTQCYLYAFIDDTLSYLGDAVERNYGVWGYSFSAEHGLLYPAERNPHSHQEAVADMKAFLQRRLQHMDENIESLLQYCSESKNKNYNEIAN